MRSISASEFKAKCLAILDEVSRGGEPIIITKRGVPVAQLGAPVAAAPRRRELGRLAGTVRIVGDIEAPTFQPDWEDELVQEWRELNG